MFKKLFGGINLTWKKVILYAIFFGVYTAIMAMLPITKDTSFRDIAIYLDAWIVIGIIIICNSKSPLESALKCFVFFLISQPLVYLIQVPFNEQGFALFNYYKYWFMWTLACLPMGFIGYYIKKNNIISMIILLPMLCLMSYFGLSYFNSCTGNFPHHLLSCIFCFGSIIIVILCVLEKKILRIISFIVIVLFLGVFSYKFASVSFNGYETYKSLSEYNLNTNSLQVTSYSGDKKGNVKLICNEGNCSIKLNGVKNGNYSFELTDENDNTYKFKYYYDSKEKTVILKEVK